MSSGAHAQTPQDFYRGKQIRMIIGHPVGNDYDLAGRFLARYLGKHIPGNPNVIIKNVPGAAGLTLVNSLYNVYQSGAVPDFTTRYRDMLAAG